MITQKCVYLFVFSVFIQVMAQDQKISPSFNSEFALNQSQEKDSEMNSKTADAISVNWFIRQVTFVDYIFKQEKAFYTQAIASGPAIAYKKGMLEAGVAINQMNFWACFSALTYALHVKSLDENWIHLLLGFGEVALVPEQQSNPDQWIYTAGLAAVLARPFKWGTPALTLTAGGAYCKSDLNLNIRAFFNLAIPIK